MNLECPKCNHKWNYRGNLKRARCPNCRKKGIKNQYVKTGLGANNGAKMAQIGANISDDIMRGNILDALDKADIDPLYSNGKLSKDFIPLLLRDDELKFAFAKYCDIKKKQPLWVVKYAVEKLLKEEKVYEK